MATEQTVQQPEAETAPAAEIPLPLPAEPPAAVPEGAPVPPKAPEKSEPSAGAPEKTPGPAAPPRRSRLPARKAQPQKRKPRRRTSPIPVSMWLLPSFRLPFSSPREFLRWFLTGINLWAVGAVALCALGGYFLLGWLEQPRMTGVEQALSGGEGTRGLTYRVERTGDGEAAVTGTWDPEKGEAPPGPELAAALCAALSPDAIYGHSDHLYRSIASRFFEGEDFSLTIVLRETGDKDPLPEPLFSVTRGPEDKGWPQPQCAAAFLRGWEEAYSGYWVFGQGRKEEMGPPQSDPILEEGDLPQEEESGSQEEEAPPLPDLEGEPGGEENASSGESAEETSPLPEEPSPEPEPPASSRPPAEAPGGFFGWILEKAGLRPVSALPGAEIAPAP